MIKLKQAIILCGGLGTRLRPFTLDKPKIMVECNDNPFLFYLIKQLSNQKINNIILCTGYKNHTIKKYLKENTFKNIKIETYFSPTNTKTGTRLKKIEDKLDDYFLLLYSDNYTNLSLNNRLKSFTENNNLIDLTVVKKNNGNIFINKNNQVYYSITRSNKSKYVEVSYSICSKNILKFYSNKDRDFQNILYQVSKLNQLSITINDNYQSISDPNRLDKTKDFFHQKKIILIDRDGVINKKPKKGFYVTNPNELFFLNKNLDYLTFLSKFDFKFIIVTNQAGINRGIISKKDYKNINNKISSVFKKKKINLLEIFTCPHHWIENCNCRKPKAGLFFRISKKYNLNLDQYVFIGDSITDMETTKETFIQGLFINNKISLKSKYISTFKELANTKNFIFNYYGIK